MGNQRKQTTVFTEPRLKFHTWVEWEGSGEHELMLPAEVITEEMEGRLAELSRYGGYNERNEDAVQGYWHWHWTIPDAHLPNAREYLTGLGLVETDVLDEVW